MGLVITVHPHACGERGSVSAIFWIRFGSSPRLWGTLIGLCTRTREDRFIPTPVGNAWALVGNEGFGAVHPHACGERQSGIVSLRSINGSSPRLWGTRSRTSQFVWYARFIPTPVGNASPCLEPWRMPPVHPHACGEREASGDDRPIGYGSSPRLWGTPEASLSISGQGRFIPTPVGNAHSQSNQRRKVPVHPHACGERTSSIALKLEGNQNSQKATKIMTPKVRFCNLLFPFLRAGNLPA